MKSVVLATDNKKRCALRSEDVPPKYEVEGSRSNLLRSLRGAFFFCFFFSFAGGPLRAKVRCFPMPVVCVCDLARPLVLMKPGVTLTFVGPLSACLGVSGAGRELITLTRSPRFFSLVFVGRLMRL